MLLPKLAPSRRALIAGLLCSALSFGEAQSALQFINARRAQVAASSGLGPVAVTFSPLHPPKTFIETIVGLQDGETAVSVSPSDGCIAIVAGGLLVVGGTASVPGTIAYTVTTSLGRTFPLAATCAPDLTALVASSSQVTAGQAVSLSITGCTANSTIQIVGNSQADWTLSGTGTTRTLAGTPSKPGRLKLVETSADGSQVCTTFPIRVAAAAVSLPSSPTSIVASGYSSGTTVAAGASTLTGWTVVNDSVFDNASGVRGLRPSTAGKIAIKSASAWYGDQSVTCWGYSIYAFLRLTGGKAFYFRQQMGGGQPNGYLEVGLATGLDESQPVFDSNGTTTGSKIYNLATVNDVVAAFGPSGTQVAANYSTTYRAGDSFTFGVAGFDIYLDYTTGGTTTRLYTWKNKALYHMAPGRAALAPYNGHGAIGTTACALAASPATHSELQDPAALLFDVRDFGCKSLTEAGIGTMAAGSNQLVLNRTNPGWAVGDDIIVEIGNEVAQTSFAYGTKGVGGAWPYREATSRANGLSLYPSMAGNTYFWVNNPADPDHGKTYDNTGVWSSTLVYYNRAIPLSLAAKVTAVSGNTLTLNKTAAVAVSGANVHSDFWPALDAAFNQDNSSSLIPFAAGQELNFPAGTWNQSKRLDITATSTSINVPQVRMWGAGRGLTTLRSPKGCPSGCVTFTKADNPIASGFRYIGSHGELGMMIDAGTADPLNGYSSYGTGLFAAFSTSPEFYDVDGLETPSNFLSLSYCNGNSVFERCYLERNSPDKRYIQWQFEAANCTTGTVTIRYCAFYSPYLTKVWEAFASSTVKIIGIVSYNGAMAMNSDGSGMLIESPKVRISKNCLVPTGTMGLIAGALMFTAENITGYSIIDINNNIANTSGGGNSGGVSAGVVNNPDINFEGWMNPDGAIMRAIGMSSQPGWTVQGTQLSGGAKAGWKGRIRAPLMKSGCTTAGAVPLGPLINSDADATKVFGMLMEAYSLPGSIAWSPGSYAGNVQHIGLGSDADSEITNCITGLATDSLYGAAGHRTGNITGAAYAALP